MKAVLLAGGRGLRLLPLTEGKPKCLLDIGGETLFERNLKLLSENIGIREILAVVEAGKEQSFQACVPAGISSVHIIGTEDQDCGIGGALLHIEPYLSAEFLVLLSDELYLNSGLEHLLASWKSSNAFAMVGVRDAESIDAIRRAYQVVVHESNIVCLTEKPLTVEKHALQGCGTYLLRKEIFPLLRTTPYNPQTGKLELIDALQRAIELGHHLQAFFLNGEYCNINGPDDVKRALEYFQGPTVATQ